MLQTHIKLAQHIKDMKVLTMPTWIVTAIAIKPEGDCWICRCTPKIPSPCLHLCAIFAPMCQAFKMQPQLCNSADRSISNFVYLGLHLVVVCFYPRPSAWPWPWRGHTYCQLVCVECYCFFKGNFEVSSDLSNSIVADLSIKALRTSSFEGAPFISRSGVVHPV